MIQKKTFSFLSCLFTFSFLLGACDNIRGDVTNATTALQEEEQKFAQLLRYASDSLNPIHGEEAARALDEWTQSLVKIQTLLGDFDTRLRDLRTDDYLAAQHELAPLMARFNTVLSRQARATFLVPSWLRENVQRNEKIYQNSLVQMARFAYLHLPGVEADLLALKLEFVLDEELVDTQSTCALYFEQRFAAHPDTKCAQHFAQACGHQMDMECVENRTEDFILSADSCLVQELLSPDLYSKGWIQTQGSLAAVKEIALCRSPQPVLR